MPIMMMGTDVNGMSARNVVQGCPAVSCRVGRVRVGENGGRAHRPIGVTTENGWKNMNHMRISLSTLIAFVFSLAKVTASVPAADFTVVDTGQSGCYDNAGYAIDCPDEGDPYFGQDAQHHGNQPAYADNGDGTISDLNTGLMWVKTPDFVNKSTWEVLAQNLLYNLEYATRN